MKKENKSIQHTKVEEIEIEVVDIEPEVASKAVGRRAVVFEFVNAIMGFIVGLAFLVTGGLLFVREVSGNGAVTFKVMGFEANISNGTPGVILILFGVLVIFISRYRVKLRK